MIVAVFDFQSDAEAAGVFVGREDAAEPDAVGSYFGDDLAGGGFHQHCVEAVCAADEFGVPHHGVDDA